MGNEYQLQGMCLNNSYNNAITTNLNLISRLWLWNYNDLFIMSPWETEIKIFNFNENGDCSMLLYPYAQ